MSIMDSPMALVDRILRRPPIVPSDEPVARMLERLAHDLEPDPLYRRRLRGEALNRFVAAREGITMERPRSRAGRMTSIGRAVLVVSVVMATGAASVSAASQSAMPGDALYGVKLRIEELRIEVAPVDLKDELVVASLDARLVEIQVMADRGDWVMAAMIAERAVEIAGSLETVTPQTSPATEIALGHHVAALQALMSDAPTAAVPALQHALDASSSAASVLKENGWRAPDGPNPPGHAVQSPADSPSPEPTATPHLANGNGNATGPGPGNGSGPDSDGGSAPESSATQTPKATKSPTPSSSPRGPASTPRGHGS